MSEGSPGRSKSGIPFGILSRSDEIPAWVVRYLMHDEWEDAFIVRQHPAKLIPASAMSGGVLLGAALGTLTSHGDRSLIFFLWLIFLFALVRFVLVIIAWLEQAMVITPKTVFLISGLTKRTVSAIPLLNWRGMTFERSSTGRLTGYGTFRIESGGAAPLVIDYVPYPDQLYMRIRNLIDEQEKKAASS